MSSNEVSELIAEIKNISKSIKRIELRISGMETTLREIVRGHQNEKEDFPTQYSTTSSPPEDK